MNRTHIVVSCLCLLMLGGLAVRAQEGAPRNLVITMPAPGIAQNQLELRWDPVPGALGYEVLRKRDGKWWLNEDDPNCIPMTNSTSITGLTPGTTFEFCVRAVLPSGLSPSGPTVSARTEEGAAPVARKNLPDKPLPSSISDPPARTPTRPARTVQPEPIPSTGSVIDLVPPPPKPKAPPQEQRPKGPPPPTPEGLMGLYTGKGDIRLSWRPVAEATGYLVEEEREGQWVTLDEGVIAENRPSLIIKGRGGAGPYLFRVRAVRYGRRSSVSLPTKVER